MYLRSPIRYYRAPGEEERQIYYGHAHAGLCAKDDSSAAMRHELSMGTFLNALLNGGFSYCVQVPDTCVQLCLYAGGSDASARDSAGKNKEKLTGRTDKRLVSLCAPALLGVDTKLAAALPLLVPRLDLDTEADDGLQYRRYLIEYAKILH